MWRCCCGGTTRPCSTTSTSRSTSSSSTARWRKSAPNGCPNSAATLILGLCLTVLRLLACREPLLGGAGREQARGRKRHEPAPTGRAADPDADCQEFRAEPAGVVPRRERDLRALDIAQPRDPRRDGRDASD